MDKLIQLNDILLKVQEFPTLPTIYVALMDVMANPRSTANHVAEIIAQDQASAAKILRVANSSIYGFHGRINNISQAIVFIGFDEVKNLVTALSIINLFQKVNVHSDINPVNLWKHSIAVGIITRMLGQHLGVKDLENYFLAGILHDIGKLLFFKIIPEAYSEVVSYAILNNMTFREAEQKKLGITHTVAGELLAEKWKLPQQIKQCIRYHNIGLIDGKPNQLVSCVHVANIFATMLGFGTTGDEVIQEPNLGVWQSVKIPEGFFMSSLQKILFTYEESIEFLLKSN